MDVELTRVSEKGQVVIPSSLRNSLRIKKSDKFLVFGDENTIVLKRVEQSVLEKSFDEIARPLRKAAKKLGLTRADLVKATAQHA
jgi:AbrB family looped-hinge helix DNA binding protein